MFLKAFQWHYQVFRRRQSLLEPWRTMDKSSSMSVTATSRQPWTSTPLAVPTAPTFLQAPALQRDHGPGLTNNVAYTCTVTATNSVDTSRPQPTTPTTRRGQFLPVYRLTSVSGHSVTLRCPLSDPAARTSSREANVMNIFSATGNAHAQLLISWTR